METKIMEAIVNIDEWADGPWSNARDRRRYLEDIIIRPLCKYVEDATLEREHARIRKILGI